MVKFADPLFLSSLKQPCFVGKRERLVPEESICPLQDLMTRGNKDVLQNMSKK